MSDAVGVKAIAEKWGYSEATIRKWCREKKIAGAGQDEPGSPWRIPKDAKCPRPIKKKK